MKIAYQYKFFLIGLVSLYFFTACSPVRQTASPVTVPGTNQFILLTPKGFKLNGKTRQSKRLALLEPAAEQFDEKWTKKTFGPLTEKQAVAVIVGGPIFFKDDDTKKTNGHLFPIVRVISKNVEEERVAAAMPEIQKMAYYGLKKTCNIAKKISTKPQNVN